MKRRSKQRGVGHVASILELTMVMGWFVIMILAEKTLSSANDARRSAEVDAVESASSTSGSACEGGDGVISKGIPQVSSALSALNGLGVPQTRTFAYYTDPLKAVRATRHATGEDQGLDGKSFEAERQLACVERPRDKAEGSLSLYRLPIWLRNLQGY